MDAQKSLAHGDIKLQKQKSSFDELHKLSIEGMPIVACTMWILCAYRYTLNIRTYCKAKKKQKPLSELVTRNTTKNL